MMPRVRKTTPKKQHTEELSKKDRDVLVAFGRKIENARKALGLNQQELLERVPLKGAGHHQSWLSRIENGQVNVSLLDVVKLARALEERPCELLTGS